MPLDVCAEITEQNGYKYDRWEGLGSNPDSGKITSLASLSLSGHQGLSIK